MQWYYSVNSGPQQGPVSNAELKKLAQARKISPTDLVWKDGLPEWIPAKRIKGLFEGQPQASSPPKASASGASKGSGSVFDGVESTAPSTPSTSADPFEFGGGGSSPQRSSSPKSSGGDLFGAMGSAPAASGSSPYSAPHEPENYGSTSSSAPLDRAVVQEAKDTVTWVWIIGILWGICGAFSCLGAVLWLLGGLVMLATGNVLAFLGIVLMVAMMLVCSVGPPFAAFNCALKNNNFSNNPSQTSLRDLLKSYRYFWLAICLAIAVVFTVMVIMLLAIAALGPQAGNFANMPRR